MTTEARKIVLSGRVQGVGYRPFVYNRARELGLAGSVLNGSGRVFVHAEGVAENLDSLEHDLVHAAPPLARPSLDSSRPAPVEGLRDFAILASDSSTEAEIHVPPDLFTCDDCLMELTDPAERRHGYPFINCTQCGPRYTLITAMPYDRPNTSMAGFPLCDDCRSEYEDPADRRFHAQPLACGTCGPTLEFRSRDAIVPAQGAAVVAGSSQRSSARRPEAPLEAAVAALVQGQVVAVKGVGGYHLICDAGCNSAVANLRERKRRPHKPLAVMFPMGGRDGLDLARQHLILDEVTACALLDPARPIVLAAKRGSDGNAAGSATVLSPLLAPGLNELGAFLPYSPLHHELLARFGGPVVATSGNISGEPVITDNDEAEQRLANVADAFLHHDRPIVRPADDPVVRPMAGQARLIRPGRGLAPLELELPGELMQPVIATGGHMKNTVALAWRNRVVISPHIGDLDSPRSNDIYKIIINELEELYNVKYNTIVCDEHPAYSSSRWAQGQDRKLIRVQHHIAHASSIAGEHPGVENWLVFAWDGVGYGSDGTLWGGEALAGRPGEWTRVGSFRPFRLVGGDKAGREPWRSAAALIWELNESLGEAGEGGIREHAERPQMPLSVVFDKVPPDAVAMARQGWRKGINTYTSSAAGRLFDAAAALTLGREVASFEGQGPMELEQAAVPGQQAIELPLAADAEGVLRCDWAPLVPVLLDQSLPGEQRAGVFHETMAQALVSQALALAEKHPVDAIGLSGGVFQNRFLTERIVALLEKNRFEVRLHCRVPANDGGLCFGQAVEAQARQNGTD